MNSSQKLMILLAASSMVINAGDNTGYISPVDAPIYHYGLSI